MFYLTFSKKVGLTEKVIAFEPQPKIYDLLNNNIELNNVKNVKVYNLGLGEEESTAELVVLIIQNYEILEAFALIISMIIMILHS